MRFREASGKKKRKMAGAVSPITRQVTKENQDFGTASVDFRLEDVEDCLIYDRHGVPVPFKKLYQERKSVIIFVRNFLCYSCKEYVEDLSKIPREALEDADIRLVVIGQSAHRHIQPFCSLTGYPYELYVDPDRCIYQKLGMKREETYTDSGGHASTRWSHHCRTRLPSSFLPFRHEPAGPHAHRLAPAARRTSTDSGLQPQAKDHPCVAGQPGDAHKACSVDKKEFGPNQ
ncbi:peroxiredoxin-like 2C isoform X2 [Pseudoliparis swirei]|uniref:peroxiredoxin-like 2C isoform X2 n=1 Tax=Pseudoliparis swirei TaxID=2059687 RepID=UPI0024BDEF6A|nr:peroxiredoxin-like 2C isoform X2 [Pseudoliparis swirei]